MVVARATTRNALRIGRELMEAGREWSAAPLRPSKLTVLEGNGKMLALVRFRRVFSCHGARRIFY